MDWLIGAIGAFAGAGAAYYKRSLSLSGAAAAMVMGTVYYGAGNLFWFGTLLLFFVTSTALSKYKQPRKKDMEEAYAKNGRRDAGQVLANGGAGMVLCLLYAWTAHDAFIFVFIGVMAAVNADTWATELGSLSRRPPRSILNGRVLVPGASGGVSWLGSLAAAAGGLTLGLGAWLLGVPAGLELNFWSCAAAGLAGGLAGAFSDSLLGASLQGMQQCTVCGRSVEARQHCGRPTKQGQGLRWMTNDAVNLISSCIGGITGWLIAAML
ncbi:DUF92 domain-containing protein [Paenibacillus sp. F411]|uniref:DUF92 domain-containing protein n=1 Tax=Paenibacillus sp. F411 TaxID=2820239 RepID=UPI001AAFED2E|nr:DUF92 domain-containing protein [Paenibacillus sp. F411]MBO2942559.1 DUF92 domain-containing protein [Paenibacillus sp. F411]